MTAATPLDDGADQLNYLTTIQFIYDIICLFYLYVINYYFIFDLLIFIYKIQVVALR